MTDHTINIRWHGRGGQGAITAAKIVANAAFDAGYKGVVMAPTFGTERRGAPVLTSLKIAKNKIYDLSPITRPDIAVVLDHLLLDEIDIVSGIVPGGIVIINTPLPPDAYSFAGIRTATADVTSISAAAGLPEGIVNTGIIGAFAKATGLLDINGLYAAIEKEFIGKHGEKNIDAARRTYEQTRIGELIDG